MKAIYWLFCILVALCPAGCGDFFNCAYRYQEEIPVKPFIVRLIETKYGNENGKLALKIFLHVINKSPQKNSLSRNRFILRIGALHQVMGSVSSPGTQGADVVSFEPGKGTVIVAPFLLSMDTLKQPLALIVDCQKKGDQERLVLIQIKDGHSPGNSLVPGEWRATSSAHWE